MSSVSQDVSHLLSDGAVRLFLLKLIAYGIMCGTAQNFFLWFLVDLGSEQTTLGLCVAVHCLSSVFILRYFCHQFTRKIFNQYNGVTVLILRYLFQQFTRNMFRQFASSITCFFFTFLHRVIVSSLHPHVLLDSYFPLSCYIQLTRHNTFPFVF